MTLTTYAADARSSRQGWRPSDDVAGLTTGLRPEDSYLRSVVTDGQQQRLGAIINGGVGEGVLAGVGEAEQALERQRVGERDLNLGGGGLLRGD
jgi:hypothetical protein